MHRDMELIEAVQVGMAGYDGQYDGGLKDQFLC